MTKFDLLVYVGRFQPFHDGHLATVISALKNARHLLILVGSANRSRSVKNPWTVEERIAQISEVLLDTIGPEYGDLVTLAPLDDHWYADGKWAQDVKAAATRVTQARGGSRVGIVGHKKDASSAYLDWFPAWGYVSQPNHADLNSTDIRRRIFAGGDYAEAIFQMVPKATLRWITAWQNSPSGDDVYRWLQSEAAALERYTAAWRGSPYPPTFVTADAVVVCQRKILMVTRKHAPGAGLLALPGGFLDANETIAECAARELSEETGLTLAPAAFAAFSVFDHPERSQRGRTITHAGFLTLHLDTLPEVRGTDDAVSATWVPMEEFLWNPCQFFEDHLFIVRSLLGIRNPHG